MVDYPNDITTADEVENPPGVAIDLYYIPYTQIETFAEPVSPSVTFGDQVIIADDHECITGKNFRHISLTMATAEYTADPTGDRGSKILAPKLVARVQGFTAALLEFQKRSKQGRYLVIFKLNDGIKTQIGDAINPAEISIKSMTGKTGSGFRGVELEITSFQLATWLYQGAIPLTPAS